MALFTNPYSGLITKGLGLEACNLVCMQFGVFFGCTITIGPTGNLGGGGGGGSYTTDEFLAPFPHKLKQKTRQVLITVKLGDKSWRKSFIVMTKSADIIINVANVIDTVKDKMYVGVSSMKRATKRVTTVFQRNDK